MSAIEQLLLWVLGILGAIGLGFLWMQAKDEKSSFLKWVVVGIIAILILLSVLND